MLGTDKHHVSAYIMQPALKSGLVKIKALRAVINSHSAAKRPTPHWRKKKKKKGKEGKKEKKRRKKKKKKKDKAVKNKRYKRKNVDLPVQLEF